MVGWNNMGVRCTVGVGEKMGYRNGRKVLTLFGHMEWSVRLEND